MKKSLKLLMAIVLFIAVIAIANCVSAASVVNLSDSTATVSEEGSVKTYTLDADAADNKEIVVGPSYSNIILDFADLTTVPKLTINAKGVTLKAEGNTTIASVVVGRNGEVIFSEDYSVHSVKTLENKGTVKVEKGRSFSGAFTNDGTMEVAGTLSNVIMNGGTLHVVKDGSVIVMSMEDGVVSVDKDAKSFIIKDTTGFKGGYVESAITGLEDVDIDSSVKDQYILFSTKDDEGKVTAYFIAPKADLQVAVKFMDVETGNYVTNLEANKVYEVEATVVYKGSECVKDTAWDDFTFTSKTTDVLMPTTESEGLRVKALKDGKAVLEVVFDKDGDAEVKREVEVTVGKVEEEPTNPENPENKPAENNKDLDKTPKTGDYCRYSSNAHSNCCCSNINQSKSLFLLALQNLFASLSHRQLLLQN